MTKIIEISANMVISKPLFQATREWRDSSTLHTEKRKRWFSLQGKEAYFYPTVFECLKQGYGNPTVASYLKLNKLLDQPQL